MLRLIAAAFVLVTVKAVDFEISNSANGPIWIGILGNADKPALENGGFVLEAGTSKTISSPEDWAGRFWARTGCDANTDHCLTGDCGNRLECNGNGGAPPVSLAEITLKGDQGLDFYDISLVDGFNIGVSFEPVNGQGDDGQYSCKKASCTYNFNADCPPELQLKSPDDQVIGCKSACLALDTDQYCCRNDYGTPETCKASEWPVDYPASFKSHCPDAYSYAYDDHKSTFTCKAEKYILSFGG